MSNNRDCNVRDNITVYYVTNIGQLRCLIFSVKTFFKSRKVRATSYPFFLKKINRYIRAH